MGTNCFTHCLFKSVAFEWEHIMHLLHTISKSKSTSNNEFHNSNTNMERVAPVIDIDANNVRFKVVGNSGQDPSQYI